MIDHIPIIRDGIDYYMLSPYLSTLYGRDEYPHRFLRVTEKYGDGGRSIQTQLEYNTNPQSIAIIENVDILTFMEYTSYGYTPYVETIFSKFQNALGLSESEEQQFFINQSLIRSYKHRLSSLIAESKMKKYTLSGRFSSSNLTSELLDEANGIIVMWEMLMNTGILKSQNCIAFNPINKTSTIPLKELTTHYETLSQQYETGKFRKMPYKLSQNQRDAILDVFTNRANR